MRLRHAILGALLGAAPAAALAETKDTAPVLGDAHRGAQLFGLHCAGCHGATGQGDGPMAKSLKVAPGAVRGPELQLARSDDQLAKAIREGGPGVEQSPFMPAFGNALSDLESWDLVAYLRQGAPRTLDFFPNAGRLLAKDYTLDNFAIERLGKALSGAQLPKEQATLQVVTVFNGEREPGHAPVIEPHDPVTLDTLKPKDKLGYVVVVPAQLPGEAAPAPVGLGIDKTGKIVKALSLTGTAEDGGRDKLLTAYVGQGQKSGAHAPLKGPPAPKPAKPAKGKAPPPAGPAAPLASMDGAYLRALEAITMYDKEERDRTWADAPSK